MLYRYSNKNRQLLNKFRSKVNSKIEIYFTKFLEDFNFIPYDSTMDEVIEAQLKRLDKDNQTQDDIQMLQIVRNFKRERSQFNLEDEEIYAMVFTHEKEENYTKFEDISVYNFALLRMERWKNQKERMRRVEELRDYTDAERKNIGRLIL